MLSNSLALLKSKAYEMVTSLLVLHTIVGL